MSNIERWVQRVDGVARVKTDLNKGEASVWYEKGKRPTMQAMWEAVVAVGYQPTKIIAGDTIYEGPESD